MSIELSLVLPFYNEEKNVQRVCEELIQALNQQRLSFELIAVNNGSWDKTAELIDDLCKRFPNQIKKVTVEINQGYGWGILQGLKIAGGQHVGYTPGDGQVPAEDIAKVFLEGKKLNLDFFQGQRIRKDTMVRRSNTQIYNFLFHLFFKCEVYDIGSNPKIMKREWYEKLKLISKDWFIDGEIALKTRAYGGKMKEFPVAFKKREEGKSKVNIFSAIEMLKNMIRWKLKVLIGWI